MQLHTASYAYLDHTVSCLNIYFLRLAVGSSSRLACASRNKRNLAGWVVWKNAGHSAPRLPPHTFDKGRVRGVFVMTIGGASFQERRLCVGVVGMSCSIAGVCFLARWLWPVRQIPYLDNSSPVRVRTSSFIGFSLNPPSSYNCAQRASRIPATRRQFSPPPLPRNEMYQVRLHP